MTSAFADVVQQHFGTATVGNQKCAVCARRIPREVPRLSLLREGYQGHVQYVRVCGACLVRLGNRAEQSRAVQTWLKKITLEEL